MADFYINNTTQMESNNSNVISDYDYDYIYYSNTYDDYYSFHRDYFVYIEYVITCVIISIGLPLTLLAIYSLYSQLKNDNVTPIFIINLLISDLIQFCCMIIKVAEPKDGIIEFISYFMYWFSLEASVCFMVCIALERYLLIAWPLWYRFRSTVKISLVVCVIVWTFSLVLNPLFTSLFCFLVPFPLFIFFLVGTLKALSAAISVPSDEKRRIVGMLVLVLLIYTLLFLPYIIVNLSEMSGRRFDYIFYILSEIFCRFSPLADLILYVFMRKGVIDKLLASLCCCRMESDDNSRTDNMNTVSTM